MAKGGIHNVYPTPGLSAQIASLSYEQRHVNVAKALIVIHRAVQSIFNDNSPLKQNVQALSLQVSMTDTHVFAILTTQAPTSSVLYYRILAAPIIPR